MEITVRAGVKISVSELLPGAYFNGSQIYLMGSIFLLPSAGKVVD